MRFSPLLRTLLLAPLITAIAPAAEAPSQRLTRTVSGIEFEHARGQEALIDELAPRFAAHNTQAAQLISEAGTVPEPALSPGEMRLHRAEYLQRIARSLGLDRLGPPQEECFDAFLGNYEVTLRLLRDTLRQLTIIRRVTLWPRAELVRQLESGAVVPGFAWDPATQSGMTKFGRELTGDDERLRALSDERKQLQRRYQLAFVFEDGESTYRASFSPAAKSLDTPSAMQPATHSEQFPVVVRDELAALPAAELAARLWDRPGGIAPTLDELLALPAARAERDRSIAFLVLHETIETAIVDHYLRSRDRRWFCDGVANHVASRVIRDRHGLAEANQAYDLEQQLARYAHLRDTVDLRRWAPADNTDSHVPDSELEQAHYAFATAAIARMHTLAGDDILPRLFRQIGQTKPHRANTRTIEAAWRKLTDQPLDTVLRPASH